MSDTPRTDAAEWDVLKASMQVMLAQSSIMVVNSFDARQLERELAAEKKRADDWKGEYLNAVSILRRERTGK